MTTLRPGPALLAAFVVLATLAGCSSGSTPATTPTPTPTAPTATLSATSLTFSATALNAATAAQTVTLSNNGTAVLSISSIAIGGADAAFFAFTNNCSSTLAIGSSCTFMATFRPTDLTTRTAAVTVATNAAASSQTVTLSGSALLPTATLSASSLAFSTSTLAKATAAQAVTLTNNGTAALTISSVALSGTDASFFALTNGCGSTLAIGASCSISATFTGADSATRAATITVTTNAAASSQAISLSGVVLVPVATLSATSLTFSGSPAGQLSAAQTVSLKNTGSAALTISSIALSGTDASYFALTNGCSTTLAAGASCSLSVNFTGRDAATRTATVTVATNATVPSQTVSLSGSSTLAPAAVLSTTSVIFANAPVNQTTAAQTVTLTNSGSAPLGINSITLGGTGSAFFATTNNCGSSLAINASCVISTTFTPTDATSRAATITLVTNAVPTTQTIAVSGTVALIPTAILNTTSLIFSGGTINTTSPAQSAMLSNTGTAPLTISSITLDSTADAKFFTTTNNCAATLSLGTSCTISATFLPTDLASRTATITITTNATPAVQTLTLKGGVTIVNKCTTIVPRKSPPAATATFTGALVTGKVLSGTQPVIGSSVQLYAAGNTGNGLAPTALGSPMTTDATGAFSMPAGYTCPFNLSTLYLVARGVKAGASGTVNSGTVLMTTLGLCNALPTAAITINEVTTVASAYALSQFLSAGASLGASATNFNGLKLAAAAAANLVNLSTGRAPGASFPSTGTPPTLTVYALANALNACVVSTTGTACTQLYAAATSSGSTTPSNTLDAILDIARRPATNVSAIYDATRASTAFAPVATASPSDWTLFVVFTGGGMSAPTALGIDSVGNIAVASYNNVASLFTNTGVPIVPNGVTGGNLQESFGLAIDQADRPWITNRESPSSINTRYGTVTVLSTAASAPTLTFYATGGLYFPGAVAFDQSQTAWIADYGDSRASLLSPDGTPLPGAADGYGDVSFAFPVAVATDSKCYGYFGNSSSGNITRVAPDGSSFTSYATGTGPSGVAVDANDNVWTANYYGDTIGLLSASGSVVSANYDGGGSVLRPQGIAIDGANNVWIANFRLPNITELAGASAPTPGAPISPAKVGFGQDSALLQGFGIAIDAAGNLWVTSNGDNRLIEFIGMAAPIRTPFIGPITLP